MQIGTGFFVGAGIPQGERVNTFVACGCCGAYHRTDFNGDCREDSERHWDLPDDAVIVAGDECEFEQMQPHEWYCVVHDVTKIAGQTEPVRCDYDN